MATDARQLRLCMQHILPTAHSCAQAYPDELIKGNAPVFVGVHFLHDIADLCLADPPALAQCIFGQAVQQHLNLARVQAAIAITVHLQPHRVDPSALNLTTVPFLGRCKNKGGTACTGGGWWQQEW